MYSNGIEREVLLEISKRLFVSKAEIIDFLKDKIDSPELAAEAITKSLNTRGLITYVMPVGGYAITQKGIREIG